MSKRIQSLFGFPYGAAISPFCLLVAQSPLGGTTISRVYHHKGRMYMLIEHNTKPQIETYIQRVSEYVSVVAHPPYEDIDIYYVREKKL
ncbi:hypothetical protein PHYNN_150 [Pantoea phage Phynn]|nr:hypothetical protein PHYNN_150 [Pantoea phage Phynn]